MKIIKSGMTYRVHGDDLVVLDQLPPKTFAVRYNQEEGYSLVERPELTEKGKVYGKRQDKVDKVWNAYSEMSRSLGVLMTGDKGIGKSLFSRMLSEKAAAIGIPTIIVDTRYPQINKFLDSIEQEVVMLFDEFEKVFPIREGAQDQLLGLFDGMSQQKRLYIVTANEVQALSPYMLSRPGRFHYHVRFKYPTVDEIKEYLTDSLVDPDDATIMSVVKFSYLHPLNYDCLRAIVFELNSGETLKTALEDLNIMRSGSGGQFNLVFHTKCGKAIEKKLYLELDGDYLDIAIKAGEVVYDVEFFLEESLIEFDEHGLSVNLEGEQVVATPRHHRVENLEIVSITGAAVHAKPLHYQL